jgi:glycosyltransferase involved in cell wall biosynthesis
MHVKEDRVDVVPLAPRAAFGPVANAKVLTEVLAKYSLPMHFALYVGDVNWNKNVIGLLSAWSEYMLRNTFARGNKLVLVGGAFLDANLAEAKEIQDVIEHLKIGDSVVRVGFVSDDDLQALYSLASVTVVPSLHEGFGFAVLESMACGGIVACADASSLPEISGPSILIDPKSSSSIAHGLAKAIEMKPQDRESLVKKGMAWSKKYTWKTVATQTIDVYKKVVSGV